jgi:recombination protein RecT
MATTKLAILKPSDVEALLDTRKSKFDEVLTQGSITFDQLKRTIMNAALVTPNLYQCTPESLYLAVMKCASVGMLPNDPMQMCFIIPYFSKKSGKYEAQFQFGYKGVKELAYEAGAISLTQNVVYEGDVFEVDSGTAQTLIHKPKIKGDRGQMIAVYSIVKVNTPHGGIDTSFYVMRKDEIDTVRDMSQFKNGEPWTNHYDEMAKKTVFLRHSKMLPLRKSFWHKIHNDAEYETVTAPTLPKIDEPKLFVKDPAQEVHVEQDAQEE